jgi:hypothetical protein
MRKVARQKIIVNTPKKEIRKTKQRNENNLRWKRRKI